LKSDNKTFLSNVSIILGGTMIAQLLSLIALPFLQKYFYTPEDFALFTWFFELTAIFVGISALRIETGIVLEKDPIIALKLVRLCLRIALFLSLFSAVCFIILSFFYENFELFTNNVLWLLLVPITIFLLGGIQILTAYYTRQQKFKELASNKVIQTTGTLIPQILFAVFKGHSVGLVMGKIIGGLFSFFALFGRIYKDLKEVSFPTKSERKLLFKTNKDFILYTTPSTFIGMFTNFIFIDLFLHYYGESFTGQLGASKIYVGMAFSVLSTSFAQVFYSKIAGIHDKKILRDFYTYWVIRLSAIALLAVIVVYLIPSSWVGLFFGKVKNWDELLPVMRIMTLWMAVMFVSSSLSYIYIKLNRQRSVIYFDIIHLTLIILSITVSHFLYHDFYTSLYWFTGAKIIVYIIAIIVSYVFINRYKVSQENENLMV